MAPRAPRDNRAMTQTTIALVLFLAPLAYSPGPGNLFFAATGARFGSDTGARRLNRVFGALLAGVAVWMLLP